MGTNVASEPTLVLVKREHPGKMCSFRMTDSEYDAIVSYSKEHEAKISDIVLSALRQVGVIPAIAG